MNDNNNQTVNFTVRQYFDNHLIPNGSTKQCLGCSIGSPLNGICELCVATLKKNTHCMSSL